MSYLWLLSGCVSSITQMDSQDADLSQTEAIIVTKIDTVYQRLKMKLYKISSGWPIAEIDYVKPASPLIFTKLEIGNETIVARFSRIEFGLGFFLRDGTTNHFIVKPGHINYIGDFRINPSVDTGKSSLKKDAPLGLVSYSFYNNEKDTVSEAKKIYPELFKKYPYYSIYTKNREGDL